MNKVVPPSLAISTAEVDAASARPALRTSAASPPTVLAIVCVGICLANLDLFIVNVALPNIGRDFSDAPLENMSWVLNGYAIAYAALLVFFGRLAERYPRNMSFLLGVGLFTLASAACASAESVVTLTAFHLAQAAGAALMTPTSLGLLLAVFPPERRGGAVRTWTAIGGLAAALGPVIGGILVTMDWRWIFLVNVPIGLVAMLVGWWKLPEVPGHDAPRPHPFDASLVTGGIGALTFAIVKVSDWGWRSPGIGITFIAAIVLLAWFVWRCLRSDSPFVDPALFRIRQFTGAALVIAPYSAAFGAMLLSVALWGQTAWGWSALKTGLAIAPGPLLVPITSLLFSGKLIARFGAAAVITAGIFFFVVGLSYWASVIGLEPNAALVIMGMILTGIGVGLTFPTLMGVATSGLRSSSFATGSGVINMIRQASLAIGVAIFVAIVGSPATPVERVAAFHRGWWIMAPIAALGLIPTLFLIKTWSSNRNRSPAKHYSSREVCVRHLQKMTLTTRKESVTMNKLDAKRQGIQVRTVVTGHDAKGRAVFVQDEKVDGTPIPGLGELAFLWNADEPATYPNAGNNPAAPGIFPPVGGIRYIIGTYLPGVIAPEPTPEMHLEDGDEPGGANDGFHRTDTTDFGVLLSGNMALELDDGAEVLLSPGDVLIENGTRHRWRVVGDVPATLASFIIGAHRR